MSISRLTASFFLIFLLTRPLSAAPEIKGTPKVHAPVKKSGAVLSATPGKFYTYRVTEATAGPLKGRLVMDLGFSNYFLPHYDSSEKFNERYFF